MFILRRQATIALFLWTVFFLTPSFAAKKLFPATRDSVPQENRYADEAGIPRYTNQAEVEAAVREGTLVPVPITVDRHLPEQRRYVRAATAAFLDALDARFIAATHHTLIVDSAVRSQDVQKRLTRWNRNAAPSTGQRASSHERGTTVDLAKKKWGQGHVDKMTRAEYRLLMYWLTAYQNAGKIHVIEERACIHVMVRED